MKAGEEGGGSEAQGWTMDKRTEANQQHWQEEAPSNGVVDS